MGFVKGYPPTNQQLEPDTTTSQPQPDTTNKQPQPDVWGSGFSGSMSSMSIGERMHGIHNYLGLDHLVRAGLLHLDSQ